MTTMTPYWTLVPCLPTIAKDNGWVAVCGLTEGDGESVNHSHWISPEGVEVVTAWHKEGEPTLPNCSVRRIGA